MRRGEERRGEVQRSAEEKRSDDERRIEVERREEKGREWNRVELRSWSQVEESGVKFNEME